LSQICVNPCKSPAKPWIPVMTCWMLGAGLGTRRPLCFGGQGPGSPRGSRAPWWLGGSVFGFDTNKGQRVQTNWPKNWV
jgi:hypothetical protein